VTAQLVSIHFRHDDVGDNKGWLVLAQRFQSFPAISGGYDPETLALQNLFKVQGLSGAVLGDDDFQLTARRLCSSSLLAVAVHNLTPRRRRLVIRISRISQIDSELPHNQAEGQDDIAIGRNEKTRVAS